MKAVGQRGSTAVPDITTARMGTGPTAVIDQLSDQQRQQWRDFRALADRLVAPYSARVDTEQELPSALRLDLGNAGAIGSMMPLDLGGSDLDLAAYGMLSEELGRTCSNVRNFVAVQDMVCDALLRWGTPEQHKRWLPEIASGETTAAFLLTEPDVGSDAQSVQTVAHDDGDEIVISGTKKWISFGQCAELFLVFAQYREKHTAVLVERNQPGVHVTPILDMLGLRGSMLAEISFDECRVLADSVIGHPGAGLVFVASASLDIGRYSTAWGAVGLAQACLEEALAYTCTRKQYGSPLIEHQLVQALLTGLPAQQSRRARIGEQVGLAQACLEEALAYTCTRKQYGSPLIEHQLVQALLTDLLTDSRAARLLCWQAGLAKANERIDAPYETLTAKYFASRVAARASQQAVQLLGAHGMSAASSAGRFYRDAKAMEIIEGTTQIIQQLLGRWSPSAGHPSD